MMILSLAILLVSFAWLQVAKEVWSLALFAGVYGFCHGGFFTLISPLVAEFFGLKAHGRSTSRPPILTVISPRRTRSPGPRSPSRRCSEVDAAVGSHALRQYRQVGARIEEEADGDVLVHELERQVDRWLGDGTERRLGPRKRELRGHM